MPRELWYTPVKTEEEATEAFVAVSTARKYGFIEPTDAAMIGQQLNNLSEKNGWLVRFEIDPVLLARINEPKASAKASNQG